MRHRLGFATRTQISVCKLPFPSAGTAMSLFHAKTVKQRPLLLREIHHHHHIRFWYLWCIGAAVVPDSGVGNTWQRLTLVLHEFLSNGLTPSRLHIVISFLTHAYHVFLGLPRFLVPGSPNHVMELLQEVARCTCPYHLRR